MLCSLLLAIASALPIPGISMPAPLDDTFYKAPSNLSSYKNGDVYNKRQVFADLVLTFTAPSEVYQVAYKSTNTQGEDSHSVATVFKPATPADDAKILSYQFWEDSAELNCSPSYSLVRGIIGPDSPTAVIDTPLVIEFAISQGWYVVVPDHEGPRSGFLAGWEQGRAGLDGIRAGISHLGLPTDTPVALYGYSGGASASVWMSTLQGQYAPELNIVAAVHGGTPVDVVDTMNYLDKASNQFSGFVVGAFAGLLNVYTNVQDKLWPHFNDPLKNAIETLRTPNNCIVTEIVEFEHQEWHTMANEDITAEPLFVSLTKNESLLMNYSSFDVPVPTFPRYIWHADDDQIIPSTAIKQYVQEQCDNGANIQFVPWKGDDHVSVEILGIPDAFQFLLQAFAGKTPKLPCGTASNDILTIVSTSIGDIIGQGIADALKLLNGLSTPLGKISFDVTGGYQP